MNQSDFFSYFFQCIVESLKGPAAILNELERWYDGTSCSPWQNPLRRRLRRLFFGTSFSRIVRQLCSHP